jgi:pyridoxal biosynthesis lyase PdxS
MALTRPADIARRVALPACRSRRLIAQIKEAVSIPVMAKARIGLIFVEAQDSWRALKIDYY